jgi:hypothetical protein
MRGFIICLLKSDQIKEKEEESYAFRAYGRI